MMAKFDKRKRWKIKVGPEDLVILNLHDRDSRLSIITFCLFGLR